MARKPSWPRPFNAEKLSKPGAQSASPQDKKSSAGQGQQVPQSIHEDVADISRSGSATNVKGHKETSPQRSHHNVSVGPTTEILKRLLESYIDSSAMQTEYQSLYRSLPNVVGITAEIMKKKEEGDAALNEGVRVVERILEDARDNAEQLSKEMMAQQEALENLLRNKESLTNLLRASQQNMAAQASTLPNLADQTAIFADPRIADLLNTCAGRIKTMVSQEFERRLGALQGQAGQSRRS
ncbi:MAG: hypothetical protein ABJL55_08380 [Roseibium sp.]